MPNVGLVLEGGAMRGMYTAGVLDVLMQEQIMVDGIVGVSAGAMFGVNYPSHQKRRVIRYNKRFNKDRHYIGWIPLLKEGNILNTHYAFDTVPRRLDRFDDEAFKTSGIPFYAVVTNTETGQAEYMRIDSVFDQMKILQASGSMPFVSHPVEIHGQTYLDGGIADSIPFQWMARKGYDRLIVVLTRDASYRKKPMNPALVQLKYGGKKQLARQLNQRAHAYNQAVRTLKEWEQAGKALVIRPSKPIEIGRLESDEQKLQDVYNLGVQDAMAMLPALQAYLSSDPSQE